MVRLLYSRYGQHERTLRVSNKDFADSLKKGSLEFTHTNKDGTWYRDCGLGEYLVEAKRAQQKG